MSLHMLTLVLVLLKAFGLISISWWWVAAPSILATVVMLAILLVGITGAVAAALVDKR